MNKIYSQVGGTCSGFAITNAIEYITGRIATEEEIYGIFEEYDTDMIEGMRISEFLDVLKYKPIANTLVDSYRRAYRATPEKFGPQSLKCPYGMRQALLDPKKAVIFSLKIRGNLELDENNVYLPPNAKIKDYHAVHAERFWLGSKRKNLGYWIENSWGSDWGENGYFKLRITDFWTEVQSVYIITFKSNLTLGVNTLY